MKPALPVVLTGVVLLAGCASGLEGSRYQSRVITGASPQDVFQAAEVLLRREFGRLARVDRETCRIETQPVEYRTRKESGTARDLYAGASTMRKTAYFVAAPHPKGAVARLRIEIERLDTERQEAFAPDRRRRLTDTPAETPIERDAATSERQNRVWTFVKRDYRLERALLAELMETFAPPPEPPRE